MSDEPDPNSDTVAASEEPGERPSDRSPSQQELHDDVKAALFSGGSRTSRAEFEIGSVLAGRYKLGGFLGRGGMGDVYRAEDLVLDEQVAIKFLPKRLSKSRGHAERFVNEVRVARQISHPNVCRVHDIGEADGRRFISMEYIDGEDLATLLQRIGRVPQEKAIELAHQLCAGLAALHDRGVLHRDLKPSNVMIDGRGRVRIADFGLASVADELKKEELRDGTPAYMAPEQAGGEEVSVRSDIFSLGVVLYELFSGAHPFAVGDTLDFGIRPDDLSTQVRGIDPEVDRVVRRCIARDPADRPASALAVAGGLPGGDPIAAAVAAGHTPSPETIAAAGSKGAIPRWLGATLGLFVCVGILLVAGLKSQTSLLEVAAEPLTPDVLEHKAVELLETTAPDLVISDSWLGINHDYDYAGAARREEAPHPDHGISPVLAHLRTSPRDIIPEGVRVSIDDPPLLDPGSARVTLDGFGRLREYQVVPASRIDDFAGDTEATPWASMHAAADVDEATLEPVDVELTPPHYADEHRAWLAKIKTIDDEQVRIEAASLGGRPVWYEVVFDWDTRVGGDAGATPDLDTFGMVAGTTIIFSILFGMVVLLVRAIHKGEADVRGGFRFALVIAASSFIGTELFAHHGGPQIDGVLFFEALEESAFRGLSVLAFYIVLDPYARRWMPRTMIGWSRLLQGRWRDPLVARDVLLGAAFSILFTLFTQVEALASDAPAWASAWGVLDALLGTRQAFGVIPASLTVGVYSMMLIFVMLLVVLVVVRRMPVAIVIYMILWVLFSVPVESYTLVGMSFALVQGAIFVVLVLRFGLLATVSTQVTANLISAFLPISLDFERWYAPTGLIAFAVYIAIALYGFRFACPRKITNA